MRNRLSYYSVLLLAGLAIFSATVFIMNPFNNGTAAPPTIQAAATTTSSPSANTPPSSSSATLSIQDGNGVGGGAPSGGGGTSVGLHHDQDGYSHGEFGGDNGTVTTITTSTAHSVYSQDQ
jgi:hypothetical protein